MIEVGYLDTPPTGVEVFNLLKQHRLLSDSMPLPLLPQIASGMSVAVLYEDDKALATLIETRPEPHVIGVMLIPEGKRPVLHQYKKDLAAIGDVLRHRWFNELGAARVESRVLASRTRTLRALKALGFKLETHGQGLRGSLMVEGAPCDVHVLGLLPTDPVKSELLNQVEDKQEAEHDC